jgi:hypothetical protein|tara:strand:- start:215 stop:844 length:630 start_codon:yes stop_codon:yes gene_type:complete
MALPSSGQISLGDIAGEIELVLFNVSLQSTSTLNLLNLNSANRPDGTEPHAISEFLGYNHTASSGLKTMMGGPNAGTKADHRSNDHCLAINSKIYFHTGAADIPTIGDILLLSENNKATAEAGVYPLSNTIALGSDEWRITAVVASNGAITDLALCSLKAPIKGENPLEEGAIPFNPEDPTQIARPIRDVDEGIIFPGTDPGLEPIKKG